MRHHKRNCQEKEKHFKCRTCDVRFERRHRLYYHSCQNVTKFIECKCCGQKFENEAMIRRHKRSQKKEKRYKCLKCDLMFDRRHKQQNHSCPNVGKCGLSNVSISSPEKMKLGTLNTIDPLKEEKASEMVMNDNPEDLYDKITGGRESIFKCHKCNMILKNNSRLRKHTKQCIATVTQSDVEDITVNLQFNNFELFESEICNFDPPSAQRRQNNTILQDSLVRELKHL